MTKSIPLTNSYQCVLVDDADWEWLQQWRWHRTVAGYAAQTSNAGGYMHNIIMQTPKGRHTDHRNRDKLDNRRSNLRIASAGNNLRNTGLWRNSTSGIKGVSWYKALQKWRAYGNVNYKQIHLGFFDDKEEAAAAVFEFNRQFRDWVP